MFDFRGNILRISEKKNIKEADLIKNLAETCVKFQQCKKLAAGSCPNFKRIWLFTIGLLNLVCLSCAFNVTVTMQILCRDLLGHSSILTTERYVSGLDQAKRN